MSLSTSAESIFNKYIEIAEKPDGLPALANIVRRPSETGGAILQWNAFLLLAQSLDSRAWNIIDNYFLTQSEILSRKFGINDQGEYIFEIKYSIEFERLTEPLRRVLKFENTDQRKAPTLDALIADLDGIPVTDLSHILLPSGLYGHRQDISEFISSLFNGKLSLHLEDKDQRFLCNELHAASKRGSKVLAKLLERKWDDVLADRQMAKHLFSKLQNGKDFELNDQEYEFVKRMLSGYIEGSKTKGFFASAESRFNLQFQSAKTLLALGKQKAKEYLCALSAYEEVVETEGPKLDKVGTMQTKTTYHGTYSINSSFGGTIGNVLRLHEEGLYAKERILEPFYKTIYSHVAEEPETQALSKIWEIFSAITDCSTEFLRRRGFGPLQKQLALAFAQYIREKGYPNLVQDLMEIRS